MTNSNRRILAIVLVGILAAGTAITVEYIKANSVKRYPRIEFGTVIGIYGKLTYVQKVPLPTAPSQVKIYRVKHLVSRKQAFLKLLKALPLAKGQETDRRLRHIRLLPEVLSWREDKYAGSVGGWLVSVWKGGQFSIDDEKFRDPVNKQGIPLPGPLPKDARKAADDFLAKIGPLSLPVHFSKVGRGQWITRGAGDKPGDTVVTKLNVSYSAELDGIPLTSAVGIQVGAGPTVVSMVSRLRQVAIDRQVPILSPKEAYDKLLAGDCHLRDGTSWDVTANITSIKLMYYQDILSQDLPYLMPIYVFEGDAVAKGMPPEYWKAYVEAVRPEFLGPKMNGDKDAVSMGIGEE